jgi:hypothetical protein
MRREKESEKEIGKEEAEIRNEKGERESETVSVREWER